MSRVMISPNSIQFFCPFGEARGVHVKYFWVQKTSIQNSLANPKKSTHPRNKSTEFLQKLQLPLLGMVIPPLIRNPYNGYINPLLLGWQDHPLQKIPPKIFHRPSNTSIPPSCNSCCRPDPPVAPTFRWSDAFHGVRKIRDRSGFLECFFK